MSEITKQKVEKNEFIISLYPYTPPIDGAIIAPEKKVLKGKK